MSKKLLTSVVILGCLESQARLPQDMEGTISPSNFQQPIFKAPPSGDFEFLRVSEEVKAAPTSVNIKGWDSADIRRYMGFADLAYIKTDKPEDKLSALESLLKTGAHLHFFGNGANNSGFIAELPNGEIIISFKGTSTLGDVATDLDARIVYDSDLGMRGHSGFISGYKTLKPQVIGILDAIAKKKNTSLPSLTNLTFIGHSLGGALAGIAALDFSSQFGNNEKSPHQLITFGAPRALDSTTLENRNAAGLKALRVAQRSDPVPMSLPETVTGLQGIGPRLDVELLSANNFPHVLGGYRESMNQLEQETIHGASRAVAEPEPKFYTKARRSFNRLEHAAHVGFVKIKKAVYSAAQSCASVVKGAWGSLTSFFR